MDKQHRDVFHEKNISLYTLLNWNESISDKLFLDNTIVNEKMKRELPGTVHYMTLYTTVNPRLGCSAKEYQMCCMHLAEQIYILLCYETNSSIPYNNHNPIQASRLHVHILLYIADTFVPVYHHPCILSKTKFPKPLLKQ